MGLAEGAEGEFQESQRSRDGWSSLTCWGPSLSVPSPGKMEATVLAVRVVKRHWDGAWEASHGTTCPPLWALPLPYPSA